MTDESRGFLDALASELESTRDVRLLLLLHLMPDKLAMIRALKRITNISAIIPIPYSRNTAVERQIKHMGIPVLDCSLSDLLRPAFMARLVSSIICENDAPIVVSEVGGYFAPIANAISDDFGGKFLGVVEDTEAGHLRYLAQGELAFPVLSVARSSLKESEDRLIGDSVAFSVERIVRRLGGTLKGRRVTILGYGKIGSSCARALFARGCNVLVWDPNPICRVKALADGFACPTRENCLSRAHILVGASGQTSLIEDDLPLLRDWAILASASSKKVEFAICPNVRPSAEVQIVHRNQKEPVLLLSDGTPVNFSDSAVVGPVLQLVHAEIIVAISALANNTFAKGLHELSIGTRGRIAELWLDSYVDAQGHVRLSFDI